MLAVDRIRDDFPILKTKVYDQPLVYLDNAATTQKPQVVLDRIQEFYREQNSNVHRGVHFLSEQASDAYEKARQRVRAFIHARHCHEIVYTSGTTHGINLIAATFGLAFIKAGDEILITQMEHHSNIVPWQALCDQKGATLTILPVDQQGQLLDENLDALLTENTKLLAMTYVSNVLGSVNPIVEMIAKAHAQNVPVLIDAAQAVPHMPIDVQALDCDFLVFSGHKVYAENGIGILYGKEVWLEKLPPYQYGGGMVKNVRLKETIYGDLPFKFEAGTGNIAAALSLHAALDYLDTIGMDNISQHEKTLHQDAVQALQQVEDLTLYGQSQCGAISFNLGHIHPYDVGMILDKMGVAVRTGMHCAEPLMQQLGIMGTVRASLAMYNTRSEIDQLVAALEKAKTMLDE